MLFGPLYNTVREKSTRFGCFLILLNFLRGLVAGVLQASGAAQLALLLGIEFIYLAALVWQKPYIVRTSMNLFYFILGISRIVTLLFLIPLYGSVKASSGTREWVSYVVLLLHALVFVLAFFWHAIQVLVEILVRSFRKDGQSASDRDRVFGLPNVFGIDQLKRRKKRVEPGDPGDSTLSRNQSSKHTPNSELIRSESNQSGFTRTSAAAQRSIGPNERAVPRAMSFTTSPSGFSDGEFDGGSVAASPAFYRRPRGRSQDLRTVTPSDPSRFSWLSTPVPADAQSEHAASDLAQIRRNIFQGDNATDEEDGRPSSRNSSVRQTPVDYAVRESDAFYYRRSDYSKPLSQSGPPGRPLGTGPMNPTGRVAQLKGIWGKILRRNPDDGKFEVVRPAGWGLQPSSQPQSPTDEIADVEMQQVSHSRQITSDDDEDSPEIEPSSPHADVNKISEIITDIPPTTKIQPGTSGSRHGSADLTKFPPTPILPVRRADHSPASSIDRSLILSTSPRLPGLRSSSPAGSTQIPEVPNIDGGTHRLSVGSINLPDDIPNSPPPPIPLRSGGHSPRLSNFRFSDAFAADLKNTEPKD